MSNGDKKDEKPMTYKGSGVDIAKGNDANKQAKIWAEATQDENEDIVVRPGLFSGAIRINDEIRAKYKNPVLVQAIRGIDYELEELIRSGKRVEAGNKLLTQLVENIQLKVTNPTFMFASDYCAFGVLNPDHLGEIVHGIADGCIANGFPLIAGETAEMPGVYSENRPEVAGTLVAIADEKDVIKDRMIVGVKVLHDFGKQLENYEKPVILTSIDGVGTKTMIGIMMDRGDTLGLDIGNHSTNDILSQGALPIAFSYFIGRNQDDEFLKQIQKGMEDYCSENNVAMMGSHVMTKDQTYHDGQYDVVGSMLGVIEEGKIITGSQIQEGDYVFGMGSNGLHTNGYSLVRKIVFEKLGLDVKSYVSELGYLLGEELLRPHRSYVKDILALQEANIPINGIMHITGGGMVDNIPRVIPEGLGVSIDRESWPVQRIFRYLQQKGPVEQNEMDSTFNNGIGMAFVVDKQYGPLVKNALKDSLTEVYAIGTVVKGEGVKFV